MNIDWNELKKGLNEELEKTASADLEKEAIWGSEFIAPVLKGIRAIGPMMTRGARAAAPYVASGIEGAGNMAGRAGDALNSGLGAGLQGIGRAGEALEGAANVANDFVINNNVIGKSVDAAKAIGSGGVDLTGKAISGAGELAGKIPYKLRAAGLAAATPSIVEAISPETDKKLMNDDGYLSTLYRLPGNIAGFGKGMLSAGGMVKDTVTGLAQGGADIVEGLNPLTSGQPAEASTNPSTFSGNMERLRTNAKDIINTGTAGTGRLKDFMNWGKNSVRDLYNTGTEGINNYLGGMGDMGKYIPAIGGLLAGGLGAYLLSRNKNRDYRGGGYGGGMPAININLGGLQGKRMPPGFLDNDPTQVQSWDSYKYGSLLKGADIMDSLSSAVGRRVADKVLNSAVGASKTEPSHREHPKTLEITSKHPHMSKLLKNKKNKEYLENLLKEQ
jgi:hypothetical protein